MYHFQVQKMTHAIMNDIVYIDHMKIADVAILDMQMSKVPIISGYDELLRFTDCDFTFGIFKLVL